MFGLRHLLIDLSIYPFVIGIPYILNRQTQKAKILKGYKLWLLKYFIDTNAPTCFYEKAAFCNP